MRLSLCLAFLALCAGFMLGCQRDNPPQREGLLLFCGAGPRLPVSELADLFGRKNGINVSVDYAGAEVLLSRMKLAQRGDLYMPGDREFVCKAVESGIVVSQTPVCYFVPTIMVQKGNPKKIGCLQDLIKPGIKLGLGNPDNLPVGRVAKRIFEKNGIPWADVEKNLRFQSATVNVLGTQIQAKSLDAVIVWDAIAHYYSEYGDEVPIPLEQNVVSTVDVGVLKFSSNKPLAERFVEFLTSGEGQAAFRKHHYRIEPPK